MQQINIWQKKVSSSETAIQFHYLGCVRITVGTPEENKIVLEELRKYN